MMLERMVEEGLGLVERDPGHDLRLGFRRRLMSQLGEGSKDLDLGRRRRVRLEMRCVEKVLPIWDAVLPKDQTPREALELVGRVERGDLDKADAWKKHGSLWTHCDNMVFRHQDLMSNIMVGYAALFVLVAQGDDRRYEPETLVEGLTDIEVDPYEHDSGFCACAAYAGGATWEVESDRLKRGEFWRWWLTDGVSEAMKVE